MLVFATVSKLSLITFEKKNIEISVPPGIEWIRSSFVTKDTKIKFKFHFNNADIYIFKARFLSFILYGKPNYS